MLFRSKLLRLLQNTFYALPLLPVALLTFYLKWEVMRLGGFGVAARSAGVDKLNTLESFSFFTADFISVCLILPLLIATLYTFNSRTRFNHILVMLTCLFLLLVLYIQLQALNIVGTFISLSMLTAAFEWGIADPGIISEYVSPDGITKLAALIFLLLCSSATVIWLNAVCERNGNNNFILFLRRSITITVITLMAFSIGIKGVYSSTNLVAIHDSTFHQDALTRSVQHLFDFGSNSSDALINLPFDRLSQQYKQLTNLSPNTTPDAFFGSSKNYDVLLFVLETAPLRSLNLQKMPNMRSLASSSFTSAHHFSTYPFTSYALFSIFTSMYPNSTGHHRYLKNIPENSQLPSFFRNLKNIGYETQAFLPIPPTYDWDLKLFNHVGLQQVVADENTGSADHWQTKLKQDKASLTQLKQHINNWVDNKQHYAAVFLPQIGHAPWHDFGDPSLNIQQRGERLLALQDQWLGELLTLLKRKKRLDKTIIIITGDHGIRTKIEDPAFAGNMIDAYSFQVPMQIYLPSILTKNIALQYNSSHIDISPTINYLMGFKTDNDFSQGSVMWHSELQHRSLFYLARSYLGVNGMVDDRGFWSHNYMTNENYYNEQMLTFGDENTLPNNCKDCSRLTEKLKKFTQIQAAWLRKASVKNME